MGALLDVFFASIVGGLLLVNVIAVNDELLTLRQHNTLQYLVQQRSADLQQLLLRDLRMAGHGVEPGTGVVRADSTVLELRGDFLRDGAPHTVRYALGDSADATMTEHPGDRLLWRRLDDGDPEAFAFGLVDLRFTYLNAVGGVAADSADVQRVCYAYTLESIAPLGPDSPALHVTGGLMPKNLR